MRCSTKFPAVAATRSQLDDYQRRLTQWDADTKAWKKKNRRVIGPGSAIYYCCQYYDPNNTASTALTSRTWGDDNDLSP
ncbi:hypothetical protein N7G274_000342 [Stereocaulon virgatum]|uniref:Uncharacterized protein n=1 Tax=Stereocaulon virgatum TaxID=373712 RepID=A0ABR4ASI9_9LECA